MRRRYAELAKYFQQRNFSDGDVVINQGDAGDTFFLLVEGMVEVVKDGIDVAVLEDGAFFGEGALISAKPRNATIFAAADCIVLEMSKQVRCAC